MPTWPRCAGIVAVADDSFVASPASCSYRNTSDLTQFVHKSEGLLLLLQHLERDQFVADEWTKVIK